MGHDHPGSKRLLLRIALFLGAMAALALLARAIELPPREEWPRLRESFAEHDLLVAVLGPFVFALLVAGFVPSVLIVLPCGFLLGPAWGAFVAITGANLGSLLLFSLSRYLARDAVLGLLGNRWLPLRRGIDRLGWRGVLYFRLFYGPFQPVCIAAAFSPLPLWKYVVGTAIGSAPSIMLVLLAGDRVQQALAGRWRDLTSDPAPWGAALLFLVAACVPPVSKRLLGRRATVALDTAEMAEALDTISIDDPPLEEPSPVDEPPPAA